MSAIRAEGELEASDRGARWRTGQAPEEARLAEAYFGGDREKPPAWERYAHALLLTNEFVFVD
jgi:hypothetical protein